MAGRLSSTSPARVRLPGDPRDPSLPLRPGPARRPRAIPAAVALGLLVAAATPGAAQRIPALRDLDRGERTMLLDDGDAGSLRAAVHQSLAWVERQPPRRPFAFGARRLTAAEHAAGLRRFLALLADDPPPEVLEERVLAEFDVLPAVGRPDGGVLVTGYHEPVVEVADRASPEFPVPILGLRDHRPGRRWRDRRFPTRAEIEAGRLGALARPLAWARDPVDVFFMEIEGSGTLRFPDGREVRVGPVATNGRPYRSVGRLLIDEGQLTEESVSMRAIRAWLAANPDHRRRVLRHNEAVVFFRRLEGPPVGYLGVPLTPARSIATDPRLFPPAALAFVRSERPQPGPDGRAAWRPVSRFVLNQDAGGAIRGPGRVDVFWGRGATAALAASDMKQLGELYFLAPRPAPRLAGARP
jgi:membrane-bound lytic murein transglycosylase A